MRVDLCTGGPGGRFLAELSDDERLALAWAAETGRALLLDDTDGGLLLREAAARADLLDRLADELVLAGVPAALTASTRRLAPLRQHTPHKR